jgi:putative transposase
MAIRSEIVDELLNDTDLNKVLSDGRLADIKKALAVGMLNAEMDQYLKGGVAAAGSNGDSNTNHRNGYTKKTVITDTSQVELEIPLDQRATFKPELIAKY